MGNYSIGEFKLDNPFVLAPLAGITDAVMRGICEEMGAALTTTEMVSAKGLYYGDRNTARLLYIRENAGPTAIQIFGSEPDVIASAAKQLNELRNVSLDINMGCPVPKVVRNGDGSALLKNPELIYDVTKAAVDSSTKPVTVKIRKGFNSSSINAVEVAKAVESAGAAALCVHGRTREQYYSGEADWDIIREVRNAISIPLIGNGDVMTAEDGIRMLDETGCDMVMVARGALGNPWIFRDLVNLWKYGEKAEAPSDRDKLNMIIRHLNELCELKGEIPAVMELRKHVGWYTKGMRGSSALRRRVNNIHTVEELKEVLNCEEW